MAVNTAPRGARRPRGAVLRRRSACRLEELLRAKNITLFAIVDHSGEAEKAGLHMPPTKLVIFGNPKAGTPVMTVAPSAAIDLPLKILIAENADGSVSFHWVGFGGADGYQVFGFQGEGDTAAYSPMLSGDARDFTTTTSLASGSYTFFVSSFQKVATFRIVAGGQKQGGNVASYFCAPDGRVLHIVAGPVDCSRLATHCGSSSPPPRLPQTMYASPSGAATSGVTYCLPDRRPT